MAQQQLVQRDPALDAFDGLRLRVVRAEDRDTPFTFLARFQSTAASLEPEERINLEVETLKNTTLLKTVFADPQARKVCALRWYFDGKEDVNFIIPLLLSNCPELASLEVRFKHYSTFDFVSSVLEHPGSKVKVLVMPEYTKGDIPRFFAALGQSQVSALTIESCKFPEFYQGLRDVLAKDLLVRLEVGKVPSEIMMSLATCTRLVKLEMRWCEFSQPNAFNHLPKSISKLKITHCAFVDGFSWSFLANGSSMRELDIVWAKGVDRNQFGGALAVHLRAKGLDKLRLRNFYFVNETLAVVGVDIGRIKTLDLEDSSLDDASIELIALALQSPNCEMKELVLPYEYDTASSTENHLVPALRHPNCSLTKLSLCTFPKGIELFEENEEEEQERLREEEEYEELEAAAKQIQDTFHNRIALFVLLQGQQVRRVYCPLRRLPVEMFRMVGMVLL